MKVCEQNNLRQRVYKMLGQHEKSAVLKHFLAEGIARRTIYNVFSRYEKGLPAENIKNPGKNQN